MWQELTVNPTTGQFMIGGNRVSVELLVPEVGNTSFGIKVVPSADDSPLSFNTGGVTLLHLGLI
jgi:hypothetical protein